MTETTTVAPAASIGVGRVLGETFRTFFGRFGLFYILGFIPTLIVTAINFLLIGRLALGQGDPTALTQMMETPAGLATFFAATLLLPLAGFAISTALIVRAAYDAKLGRPITVGAYFGAALVKIVPIILVSLVIILLTMLGAGVAIAPGAALAAAFGPDIGGVLMVVFALGAFGVALYIYAASAAAVPAIIIENLNFGAIGRSWGLTKGQRWSVIGAFVLLVVVAVGINLLASLVLTPITLQIGQPILAVGVGALIGGAVAGFQAVFYAVLYARLREVKEGASVDNLATVFE